MEMHNLEKEDIKKVAELPYNWQLLTNKHVVISGGTGFLGAFLCNVLRYRNENYEQSIKVTCISRHARENDETVEYVQADICNPIRIQGDVDYVIHMASNTHPEQYKNDPVGTIIGNVFGAYNLLMLAKENKATKFILLSSCEIYGEGSKMLMDENYCGYINSNTARAGYNESKRVSESLCQSFAQQYGVNSCICRMARVFGADKTKADSKAMAQFIRNAINNEDIVLKSKGLQQYSFIYIADAVSGILKVLFDGKIGDAYNIAGDYEGMSLGQYAEFIAHLGCKKVVYDIEDNPNASQAQFALLDTAKIKAIGYNPIFSVKEGLIRTYRILTEDNSKLTAH